MTKLYGGSGEFRVILQTFETLRRWAAAGLLLACLGCGSDDPQKASSLPENEAAPTPARQRLIALRQLTGEALAQARRACESPLTQALPDEEPLELPPVCLPGTTPAVIRVHIRSLDGVAEVPEPLQRPFRLHLTPFDPARPDRACQFARIVDFDSNEWPRATLGWNPAPDQPVRGDDNYVAYEPGYDPGLYARAAKGQTILFEQSAPKRLPDVPRDCREQFTLPELVMAARGGPKRAAILTPEAGP